MLVMVAILIMPIVVQTPVLAMSEEDTEIYMPDEYLKAAINKQLRRESGAPIYRSDIEMIDSLTIPNAKITSLEGLQYASNLSFLNASGNKIKDIHPITGLTSLRMVYINSNEIEEISGVENLINLETLGLDSNRIKDITSLSTMNNLKYLGLGFNGLTDIRSLKNLNNLEELSLSDNQIYDLTPLESLTNLTNLWIYNNQITDKSSILKLPNLKNINLDRNFIAGEPNQYHFNFPSGYETIDVYQGGTVDLELEWFYNEEKYNDGIVDSKPLYTVESKNGFADAVFQKNNVEITVNGRTVGRDEITLKFANPLLNKKILVDVLEDGPVDMPDPNLRKAINKLFDHVPTAPILKSELSKIDHLQLSRLGINNLDGLQYAVNVKELNSNDNEITNVKPLETIKGLKNLSIGSNRVTDLTPLRNLESLTSLYASNNQIEDLTPLKNLRQLSDLYLSSNQINNIEPVAFLNSLEHLELNANSIEDISTIAQMDSLLSLDLGYNQIKDIHSLSGATKLVDLKLHHNEITDISAVKDLGALFSLDLGQNQISDISPIENLQELSWLFLNHNRITGIEPLSKLTKLSWINLMENQLSDIRSIDHLQEKAEVHTEGNFIPRKTNQYSLEVPEVYENLGSIAKEIPIKWRYNDVLIDGDLNNRLLDQIVITAKNGNVEASLQTNGNILAKALGNGEDEITIEFLNPALNRTIIVKGVEVDETAPTKAVVNGVTNLDTSVTGEAEAGSTIEIKVNDRVIGTGVTEEDGQFTVLIPVQEAGTELEITAVDNAGNKSDGVIIIVKDRMPPVAPAVDKITDRETVLTGTAEASTTVIARVGGNEIGRDIADQTGAFKISISKPRSAKTVIEVQAVDQAGNASEGATVTVDAKLQTLVGATRYTTAVEVSRAGWKTSDTVFLVNGYAIVDGLTATPLASAKDSPILLTKANTLNEETMAEISRLKAKNIILIGGTTVLSPVIETDLINRGYNVKRLGGTTRYDTSLLIAQELDKIVDVSTVFMAFGFGEPDALSIAAYAGQMKQPIILTSKDSVPTSVYNWLKAEQLTNSYFIGGTSVIAPKTIDQMDGITSENVSLNRISGQNRHETNAKVISKFYPDAELTSILVTKSETASLVDALTAGPLAVKLQAPVLLVSTWAGLHQEQLTALSKKTSKYVHQIGGGINPDAVNKVLSR
jgi:Leucine-rich repeat (LRR) protein/putative cell wall-binding protein